MLLPMVHVDDADDIAAAHQRDRQESFVGIFDQGLKSLEARVRAGIGGQRDHGLVLGHPTGDAFAHLHAQISQRGGVRQLRSAQHDLVAVALNQVNQARVAFGNLRGDSYDFPEHLVERKLGAHNAADAM